MVLKLVLTPAINAKAYQVQYSTGTGTWQDMGIFPNTKNIFLPNLTAGSVWNFRIRAVGGSTHYSE